MRNPILLASGTAGYAKEMAPYLDFHTLGGLIPKTVTQSPRAGNAPPRTVETASGLLNAIGLDNDGLEHFLSYHLPELRRLPTAIIGNIAGKTEDEFVAMAERFAAAGDGLAGLELNLSCPNVSGGLDFATKPEVARRIVERCRRVCPNLPLIAKLTPNVTDITEIARAARDGGADAVSCVNTFLGLVLDWRKRKPILGNGVGGLSGPAIKPLALRCVWQVAKSLPGFPILAVGGIMGIDDVMDYLVAGASAVQVGTANFHDPTLANRLVDELPRALEILGAASVREIVRTMN